MKLTFDGKDIWINYQHLYYFKVIASEGSIAKASEVLRLGQPTLSAQLKSLEDVLGVPLFERKNRRLFITEAGEKVLEYANEIFRLGYEMFDVVHDQAKFVRPQIQIGVLDSVPKNLVSHIIVEAHRQTPCHVSIFEGKGDELLRELFNHRVDIVISNFVPLSSANQNFFSRSIDKEPVSIFGSPKFKNLKKDFPNSLNHQPIILPTLHSRLRQDVSDFFRQNNIQIDRVAETQDTSLQVLLALSGLGVTPLPRSTGMESGNLIELGQLPGILEEYFFLSTSRKIENPIASRLLKRY